MECFLYFHRRAIQCKQRHRNLKKQNVRKKNTEIELKNAFDGLICSLTLAKEINSYLENVSIESLKTEK